MPVMREILAFRPRYYTEFRDPFCGNCPWLWETTILPGDMPRWINDLDWWVYTYFVTLQRNPNFIYDFQKLRAYTMGYEERTQRAFGQCREDLVAYDCMVSYLFLRRHAFKQICHAKRSNIASMKFADLRDGLRPVTKEKMAAACKILQGVRITNHDAWEVIAAPTNGVAFLLLDPPYNIESHCSGLYEFEMSVEDHTTLRDKLLTLDSRTHRFLMTIEYGPISHELYRLDDRFVTYRRPTRYRMTDDRAPEEELLVMNYNL